jgi:hypothetical protein
MKSNNQAGAETFRKIAGISAILAGIAWLVWIFLNISTNGELDTDGAAISLRLAKFGQLLMIAWNLLLIPAAIFFGNRFYPKDETPALFLTICGVVSQMFWAYGGATRGITPMLEVTYLFLSGIWWLGSGLMLRGRWKMTGNFTVVVGAFALLDALLSFLEPVPFWIYALAAPKLPLAIIWNFWIGVFLLRTGGRI